MCGQPLPLLQDSGLRPRVGDGPGTTPKLSWAALRVALREITLLAACKTLASSLCELSRLDFALNLPQFVQKLCCPGSRGCCPCCPLVSAPCSNPSRRLPALVTLLRA